MKIKLVALTLIAFVCWLVPIKTLAQETYKPKTKVEAQIEQLTPPSNVPEPSRQPEPPTQRTIPQRSEDRRYDGRIYSKDEVQQLIRDYSAQYDINPEVPLCVARLESGFNQFSKNRSSTASGVFQYLSSTWRSTDEGKAGLSVFDADANVKAAVKYMAIHKSVKPWIVWPKCPSLTK